MRTGVPAAAFANHGAATSSTKLSTTSLRQTNELHSGYSTARVRPTISHLATVAMPPATAPAARITAPDSSSVSHGPSHDVERLQREQHAERDQHRAHHRHEPAQLDQRPGDLELERRVERPALVAARPPGRRSFTGGEPSHDVPALDFFGAADSTATRPFFGTDAAGRGHPGVAEEGPLADLRAGHVQPAAAQLVRRDHRVVGQERALADRGHLRQQQHGRRLDVPADLGAQRAQPPRRQQARVQREQQVRAESSSRSVAHTCQPIRLRTG